MKKKMLLLYIIFLLPIFSACAILDIGHIEDLNGEDDHSIVTITDEEIIKGTGSVSLSTISTTVNNKTNLSIKKFSGVMELEQTKVNNQNLVYNINSQLNSGNFRIVIVLGNEIIRDIEIGDLTKVEFNNASGIYKLKIVGESANFILAYTITK